MSDVLVWDQFARDLAAAHGEGFVRDFCKTLLDEQRAEEEVAYARQREIAAASERLDAAYLDGLGECHMRVDADVYFHWVRNLGRDCWNDKQFVAEFKRDNPDVRVLTKTRKSTVVR
jgi:hypothetical protein